MVARRHLEGSLSRLYVNLERKIQSFMQCCQGTEDANALASSRVRVGLAHQHAERKPPMHVRRNPPRRTRTRSLSRTRRNSPSDQGKQLQRKGSLYHENRTGTKLVDTFTLSMVSSGYDVQWGMNRLSTKKRAKFLELLVEGVSMCATSRLTNVSCRWLRKKAGNQNVLISRSFKKPPTSAS